MSDDDDERMLERLREIGLLHLADRPEALRAELARRIAARDAQVEAGEREAPAPRPPPPPKRRIKSSTLLFVTKAGGPCRACRHLNHGTADHAEGRWRCERDGQPKTKDQRCDVTIRAPRRVRDDPPSGWATYLLFEPFDGTNGTWGVGEDYRLLGEDADHEVQASVQADVKFIPGRDLT